MVHTNVAYVIIILYMPYGVGASMRIQVSFCCTSTPPKAELSGSTLEYFLFWEAERQHGLPKNVGVYYQKTGVAVVLIYEIIIMQGVSTLGGLTQMYSRSGRLYQCVV